MIQPVPATAVAAPGADRAKVFVSYSRKDAAFAQMLVGALTERGFDAFLDKTDIAPGEPWKERLAGLIATSDTVVFAVSPDSVASTICGWELEESARLRGNTTSFMLHLQAVPPVHKFRAPTESGHYRMNSELHLLTVGISPVTSLAELTGASFSSSYGGAGGPYLAPAD
jgi:hypothetical protein